jgi:hypothetical protein
MDTARSVRGSAVVRDQKSVADLDDRQGETLHDVGPYYEPSHVSRA